MLSKKKIILIVAGFLLLIAGAGWYFKPQILGATSKTNLLGDSNFQNITKTINDLLANQNPLAKMSAFENSVLLSKEKVIAETNIARHDNGALSPLAENSLLNEIALKKAQDMFDKQYFEHVSPDGVGPGDLAKSMGYDYIAEGENLILGNFKSEKEMVDLWMQSPGHRANILHAQYLEIGVAVLKGKYKDETVWIGVQEFGIPVSACPKLDKNFRPSIEADMQKLKQMETVLDAKKSVIDAMEPTSETTANYNQLVDEYNQLAQEYNNFKQAFQPRLEQYNKEANALDACIDKNR